MLKNYIRENRKQNKAKITVKNESDGRVYSADRESLAVSFTAHSRSLKDTDELMLVFGQRGMVFKKIDKGVVSDEA